MKLIICVITILLAYSSSSQISKTIYLTSCNDFGRIGSYAPDNSFPSEIELYSGAWTINGDESITRNFFKFDLTDIPKNAQVTKASLDLHYAAYNTYGNQQHSSLSNSNESFLARIIEPWKGNVLTWNNQPEISLEDYVILPQSTSGTQDYVNIDVTKLVQKMISDANYGLSLRLTDERYYAALIFASAFHPNDALHPKLKVEYTMPTEICKTYALDDCFDQDARIDNYAPNTNFSNEIEYFSGAWTISGQEAVWRNLFQFNHLSEIPLNSTIISAQLNLNYAPNNTWNNMGHSSLNHPNTSIIRRITQPWSYNSVTWNNQPTVSTDNEVVLTESINASADYKGIDVTNLVQDMIEYGNYGMMLGLSDERAHAAMIFASSKNPDASLHPILQVCYTNSTSITLHTSKPSLEAFPNPSANHLILNLGSIPHGAELIMYNLSGQETLRQTISSAQIIIETTLFKEGLYNLAIFHNGQQLLVQKISIIR